MKKVEGVFFDVEKAVDLSIWERKLGNKRTKAGKYYWYFLLIYFQHCRNEKKPINFRILTKCYWSVFYRPEEFYQWLLSHLNGEQREYLLHGDYGTLLNYFVAKFKKGQILLEDDIRKWFKENPRDFSTIDPAEFNFYDLDFLDNHHPHLPVISDCYKSILDAANYPYDQNSTIVGYPDLKPKEVKVLNNQMNELIISEYMYHFVSYVQNFTQTGVDVFTSKLKVSGPTEALRHAVQIQPEILEWPDQKLKYQLSLKYSLNDGNPLNRDSLQTAIRKIRK